MNWRGQLNLLLLSVSFLTRIPVGNSLRYSEDLMNQSLRYYPVVGLLLGLILSTVLFICQSFLPLIPSVIITVASGIAITGAFHEDGFADLFDGIGGGTDVERTLDIMKDSRLGTYGVSALAMMLLLKISVLVELAERMDISYLIFSLTTAQMLSRTSAVLVIASSDYVRLDGKAKPIADAISSNTLTALNLITFISLIIIGIFMGLNFIILSVTGAAIGHFIMRRLFEPRLKGYTGDCLGAVQQASELGIYVVLLGALSISQ